MRRFEWLPDKQPEPMNELPIYVVDAFTAAPFRGNPASVCLLDRELSEPTMQVIAAEMNHSETAFVRPLDGSLACATRFSLRWFTPLVEVPLCGHATLATSAVIFRELGNPALAVHFETRSGTLSARREGPSITLDFPAEDHRAACVEPEVVAALGARAVKAAWYARKDRNLLLHLATETEVRELAPDFARLRVARGEAPFLGVIVTAAGSDGYDFVSRYFAPWVGIDEDPVTGVAHCALAPYWAGLTGKRQMRAYQASRRGGELTVRFNGERVDLVGEAVVVAAGLLRLG
jgi:PhzF family phenazine biosynthesis protein